LIFQIRICKNLESLLVLKQNYDWLILSFQIVLKHVFSQTVNQICLSSRISRAQNRDWGERRGDTWRIYDYFKKYDFTIVLHIRANWRMHSHLINATWHHATRLKTETRYNNRELREQCYRNYQLVYLCPHVHMGTCRKLRLEYCARLPDSFVVPFVNDINVVNNTPKDLWVFFDRPLTKQVCNWATKCHMCV